MRTLTFDIETANFFSDVGSNDPADLTIALVCTHDSTDGSYETYLEADLPKLWRVLEQTDMLVGFNSDHFDIPLLNKYYPGDLTRIKSLDLMKEVQAVMGRRLRLDAIAEGTLGKRKSDGKGGQSVIWWREGKVEQVAEYCKRDVELTRAIFDYALEHNCVKYKELGRTHEVKLDTSSWLIAHDTKPMTFSMGF